MRPAFSTPRVLWSGSDPDAIPDEVLQGDVVIKANHASGTNHFVTGGELDREEIVSKCRRWLDDDYSLRAEEWGYRNIPRRIFVEEIIGKDAALQELKFYTFGAHVGRLIQIVDRFGAKTGCRYDPDEAGDLVSSGEKADVAESLYDGGLPDSYPKALAAARQLGACFDHARVDLFTDGGAVWFNEITVYNMGGKLSYTGNLRDGHETKAWDLRRSAFFGSRHRGWRGFYAASLRRHLDRSAARGRVTDPFRSLARSGSAVSPPRVS